MGIGKNIKLNSLDTLFGNENNGIIEIAVSMLLEFKNHPFKVVNDEKMDDMIESIKEYGVLTPIIVRQKEDMYEIVSGHRRKFACEQLGITKIPAIIKELNDDEAAILMVDSNIQREEILPSEKAFAYKIKSEALKRQTGRKKKNEAQVGLYFENKPSIEILADEVGESRNQIKRHIRLTYLISELLDMVDNKKLPFNTSVQLSFLRKDEQAVLYNILSGYNQIPSLQQATNIKALSKEGKFDEKVVEMLLTEETKETKINITNKKIKKYFPEDYTAKQMEEVIYKLLEDWQKNNGN